MSATTIDDIKAQCRKEARLESIKSTIMTILTVRFGETPVPVQEKVLHCQDFDFLEFLLFKLAKVKTLDEFKRPLHLE
ncbi:MAG: hypothetical protein LBU79_09695 [Planctomycetota bacterium]|nr:hypothetical protein [Planctomycetota bacterium]